VSGSNVTGTGGNLNGAQKGMPNNNGGASGSTDGSGTGGGGR